MSVNDINNNVRIRTTPLGSDKYLKVNLNQNFDFLEILSLKIGQEQIYKQYCSDYGVIVGRVVCNEGVGVPNAKVSIFIPISEEDSNNPKIRALYPYENLESVDFNNIKYNLLSETPRQDDLCHRTVGTFPEKRRILDCDPWCEVFGKYYKFTTSTNASGDYMIFGVPTGVQTVHMDVDLSDIGYLSQKPYDMVNQGSPNTMFDSLNQFKTSPNLAQLPQIKTQNKTINVLPFWGDLEQCQVGINRVDFDLNYKIIPSAFFIGSIFGDSNKNAVSKTCRPRPDVGLNVQLNAGEGRIDCIRRTPNGGTEAFDVNGGRVIDEDGTWIVQLPMNLETKITDEFGNLVDSGNPQIGIATKAKYRFKIGLNESGSLGRLRARAKFLVPNYGDYSFDDTTPDTITVNNVIYPNFSEMEWNGVYTVKEFISRYSKRKGLGPKSYTGIKDTGNSGNLNPFPYNSISQDIDFLFIFLCLVATVLGLILSGINLFISTFNGFIEELAGITIPIIDVDPFGFLRQFKIPCISITVNGTKYCPACDNNRDDADWCEPDEDKFFDAVTNALAVAFNIFKFNFIEDWINGSLYAFSFKLKDKQNGKSKFCNVDNSSGYGTNYITSFNCGSNKYDEQTITVLREGIIKFYQGEYFYAPKNSTTDWLYPTDTYNLGSMKACDILGKPKIVLDIPPTTFNLPSDDFGATECDDDGNCVYEQGIEPFLMTVNCVDIKSDLNQCINTRRYCELGVDYDEDLGQHDLLGNLDISDVPAFGPSLLRGNLECLNVPFICNDCTTPPDGQFTEDWERYRTGNLLYDGITNYSETSISNLYRNEFIRNSFYFYFGITPGKTAIDKLLSQYFAPCERSEPCPIYIEGNIINNTCLSGNTGSITAVPKYGTPPYKYDWFLGYYLFGDSNNIPFSLNGGDTINNLYSDIYTVVVSDSVGNICKKSFSVLDPSPFIVSIDYSPFICANTNNGYINVTPGGGTPPYYIDWGNGADVTQFTGNSNNSFFLTNLPPTSNCTPSFTGTNITSTTLPTGGSGSGSGIGTNALYQAVIWDSSNGCLNKNLITVDITQSCGFTLTATSVNDYCSASTNSSITVGVTGGGVPPFIFTIQSTDTGYFWSGKTSNSVLTKKGMTGKSCPGATYNITCVDSCGSIGNTSVTILKSRLESLVYAGQATYRNQEWYSFLSNCFVQGDYRRTYYVSLFKTSAPTTNVVLTDSCPYYNNGNGKGYYTGLNSSTGGLSGGAYTVPNTSFWYVLPPDIGSSIGISTSEIDLYNFQSPCDTNRLKITRTPISSTQSRIELKVLSLNVTEINSGDKTFDICRSETIYVHEIFLNSIGDCVNCKWTIKTTGCSDNKLDDKIQC